MPKRVHHVAVALRDLDRGLAFFSETLALPLDRRAVLDDLGVEVALLRLANTELELITPMTTEGSIARFLDRRGEGLHHVCFTTPDIDAEMRDLRSRGVELIDEAPRRGIAGRVCFFHPRAHAGVLVELVEAP